MLVYFKYVWTQVLKQRCLGALCPHLCSLCAGVIPRRGFPGHGEMTARSSRPTDHSQARWETLPRRLSNSPRVGSHWLAGVTSPLLSQWRPVDLSTLIGQGWILGQPLESGGGVSPLPTLPQGLDRGGGRFSQEEVRGSGAEAGGAYAACAPDPGLVLTKLGSQSTGIVLSPPQRLRLGALCPFMLISS